jgi:hypothetical protein
MKIKTTTQIYVIDSNIKFYEIRRGGAKLLHANRWMIVKLTGVSVTFFVLNTSEEK